MMNILKSHRTVRKYKVDNIPDDLLSDILDCGVRASNTGNMQLYSIIVSVDCKQKELLSPFHFNQPMVKNAPVLLTICFDLNRFNKWCDINTAKSEFNNLLWILNGTIDASILAQNICVAAESHGLGICYLGTTLYNAPEISQILHLPVGVIPITALTIGYPEVIPDLADRLPNKAVIHYEEYRDFDAEAISELYKEKENLESSKHFVAENGKDNLAQVYTEVRYKAEDSIYFSVKLKKMLIAQGFNLD